MEYKISVENFKSIIQTEFDLKRGLNILIGPNGAGKTCLLTSLKFLRDIFLKGIGLAMAKGGGPSRIYNRGKTSMKFSIEFIYGDRTYRKKPRHTRCRWEVIIEQKGIEKLATISYEKLSVDCTVESTKINLFLFEANRKNLERPKLSFAINPDSGKDLFNKHQSEHPSYSKEKLTSHSNEILNKICTSNELKKTGERSIVTFMEGFDGSFSKFLYFFSSINEYNIIPERARQATEQLPFARMSANGFGISEVIEALEKKNFHKVQMGGSYDFDVDIPWGPSYYFSTYGYRFYSHRSRKSPLDDSLENINKELSSAVKPINKVSVEIDQTNGRRFVIFKSEKESFYPDEVSDGTIKWLCILTSIYVGFSNIYLLEEPENFLHPWMQQKLIKIMREQSEKNNTIYVLTTHSTTLLNSAFPEEVIIVQQKNKGTEVERIKNQEEVQAFLENSDFRLGDLWVSGGIGAVPQ
jgi:predicted ATPase